jgi:hemin uptake protein HemP
MTASSPPVGERPRPASGGADEAPAGTATSEGRSIASEALFAGAREVQIVHRGSLYRLKQTALGKLILTK